MSRVLVVDDEPSMCEYLEALLTRAGYDVETAAGVDQARASLEQRLPACVISDFRLGAGSGLEVLKATRALRPPPEVIIITAYGTPASAVDAMRAGAYDYISKPFDNDELLLLVERAIEKRGLVEDNQRLKATLPPAPYFVGASASMKAVWALVDKVAATKSTVLITGESGTGKEVVSRAIHRKSPRAAQPFVAINCGAIAEGLLESELFGYVKGAFTGAAGDREGLLVSAGSGTVLLDEIGELPLGTQVKLLRVLQERTVRPVGSTREVPFEARVVAATNRRLDQDVKTGRFREDLYFRLNVIALELPPLRERREDIAPLAQHFLKEQARDLGRPRLHFTPEALEALERAPLPGNARQLANIVERSATLSDGDELTAGSLSGLEPVVEQAGTGVEVTLPEGFSLERHLDGIERAYLRAALDRANGVRTGAAQVLGLSFRSLRYRLSKFGLG